MAGVVADYDSEPERAGAFRASWQEDVHGPLAERLIGMGAGTVLDVGCGIGRFAIALGGRVGWIGVDRSPGQLARCRQAPAIRADAGRLPFADDRFDAAVLLWMLYHLDEPRRALAEAGRVVRPGGVVVAGASARGTDPELVPGGYPRTTFDAEEAADVVADVFGGDATTVERWDAPVVRLHDRAEVAAYARSHLIPADVASAAPAPITLTKRGCLVWARVPA